MPTDYDSTHEDDVEGVTVSSKHQAKPRAEDQPVMKKKKIAKRVDPAALATHEDFGIMNKSVAPSGDGGNGSLSMPMQEESDDDAVLIPKRNITASRTEDSDDDVPLRKKQTTSYSVALVQSLAQGQVAQSNTREGASGESASNVPRQKIPVKGVKLIVGPGNFEIWVLEVEGSKDFERHGLYCALIQKQETNTSKICYLMRKMEKADGGSKLLIPSEKVFFETPYAHPRSTLSPQGAMFFISFMKGRNVDIRIREGMRDLVFDECRDNNDLLEALRDIWNTFANTKEMPPIQMKLHDDAPMTEVYVTVEEDQIYVKLIQAWSGLSGISSMDDVRKSIEKKSKEICEQINDMSKDLLFADNPCKKARAIPLKKIFTLMVFIGKKAYDKIQMCEEILAKHFATRHGDTACLANMLKMESAAAIQLFQRQRDLDLEVDRRKRAADAAAFAASNAGPAVPPVAAAVPASGIPSANNNIGAPPVAAPAPASGMPSTNMNSGEPLVVAAASSSVIPPTNNNSAVPPVAAPAPASGMPPVNSDSPVASAARGPGMSGSFVPDSTVEMEDISESVRKEFAGNSAEEAFEKDFQAGDRNNEKERRVAKRNRNQGVATYSYDENVLKVANRLLSENVELIRKQCEEKKQSFADVAAAKIAAMQEVAAAEQKIKDDNRKALEADVEVQLKKQKADEAANAIQRQKDEQAQQAAAAKIKADEAANAIQRQKDEQAQQAAAAKIKADEAAAASQRQIEADKRKEEEAAAALQRKIEADKRKEEEAAAALQRKIEADKRKEEEAAAALQRQKDEQAQQAAEAAAALQSKIAADKIQADKDAAALQRQIEADKRKADQDADAAALDLRIKQVKHAEELAQRLGIGFDKAMEYVSGSPAVKQPEPQNLNEDNKSKYMTIRDIFYANRNSLFPLVDNYKKVKELTLIAGGEFAQVFAYHKNSNPLWKHEKLAPWNSGPDCPAPWSYSPACFDAMLETIQRFYEYKYGSQTRITEHYAHVPNRSSD